MSLKNKTVMVTGGAGFIGSHLIDRIIREKPERIVIVDNFFLGKHRNIEPAMKTFDNIKLYYQDAGHYEKMKNIFEIENIEVVFNLAVVPLLTSHSLPKITCEDNINITLSALELLREGCFKTLIHCSSSEAYGTAMEMVMDEGHPLNPTTPYAASKAACDLLVQSYENTFGLDCAIIRPFNNYGPRQNEGSYAGIIPITIERIMAGKQPIIHGDGLQTRDYIYVSDTVEGMIQIYNNSNTRGKVINLATGQEISVLDMVKAIARELNYAGEFDFQPPRLADVRRHRGDITLAKKMIGFEPGTSFEAGIKETVAWYRKILGK
ncbi:MAG: NAD-dependent epimerase/dehydratase family protein [Euryarchaeota archaeon]|nr:NAD-dependent epimerase/dehydratase family protein [Euryarchaeota archaeon]MBU4032163.1 GDP-mannose 4,6-dehydratase [Candidatus Thermoplasmatota archaeon]MBU4072299.1 GDP-mannose 4,6-dehydratase [Candidatus Thermoplasmatota archaeon]MBU4143853.1 GDP-mannose 4,6-dehydratase [Candidatus Thermoplasmatota archaeon]